MQFPTQQTELELARQALKRSERIGNAYALGVLPALVSVALLLFFYKRFTFAQPTKIWALAAIGLWMVLYLFWCRRSKKKQADLEAGQANVRRLEAAEKLAAKKKAFGTLLEQLEARSNA